jgi:hypothetical protein
MSGMGRSHSGRAGRAAALVAGCLGAALVAGPGLAAARATTAPPTTTTTTTTTRPQRPGVFTPTVSPSTIANRSGCGPGTSASITTGSTGKVDRVTFRVEVGGRTTYLSATPSGSRWSAMLDGNSLYPEHGSGTVRATAAGPSGTADSGDTSFTLADCRH